MVFSITLSYDDEPPILVAAKHGSLEVLQLLETHYKSKDINAMHIRNRTHSNISLIAAQYGQTRILQYLIQNNHYIEIDSNKVCICGVCRDVVHLSI